MIRIRHNGTEKTINSASHANLGEAIEACLGSEQAAPQVVLQVRVNGCDIPEDTLSKLSSFPLEGISEIEIRSEEPEGVARSCLGHCEEYATRIRESLGRTAELLRQGRIVDANGLYAEVLDALSVFVGAVGAARMALGTVAEHLGGVDRDLAPWLEQLVEAQQSSDWIRVADYLEFELDPILEKWAGEIAQVRQAGGRGQESAHEG